MNIDKIAHFQIMKKENRRKDENCTYYKCKSFSILMIGENIIPKFTGINYPEYDKTIRNRKNPNERKFLLFWLTTMKTFDAVYDESFVVEQFSARNWLWLRDSRSLCRV